MDTPLFKDIIQGRRSIRRFTDQPVSPNTIRELVDCARYAPSDTNSQTWEFVAVLDREKIKQLAHITWQKLHRIATEAEERDLTKEARLLVRSFGPYATAFENAPALIIVLAIPYTSKFRDRIFDPLALVSQDVWELEGTKSSALAAQNLMLAAHAMGLGSCPMTGPVLLAEQEVKTFLNIHDNVQLNMVVALGYPDEHPTMPKRKEVDEILRIISE